jgi:hypothetical protein
MAENSNQTEIPAEILKVATKAINDRRAIIGAGMMTSDEFARLALEAANVGALLAERDGLAKNKQTLTTVLILQAERITELEAELTKHQESRFHPDWSALEATRKSLREAWAKLKETEQTATAGVAAKEALREAK